MGQQAGDQLGDEIVGAIHVDERFEHNGVGATVRMQEHMRAVGVAHREVGGTRGLCDAVRESASNLGALGVGTRFVQGRKDPPQRLERQAVDTGTLVQGARPDGVRVVEQAAHVQRVGDERVLAPLPIPSGDMALDIA